MKQLLNHLLNVKIIFEKHKRRRCCCRRLLVVLNFNLLINRRVRFLAVNRGFLLRRLSNCRFDGFRENAGSGSWVGWPLSVLGRSGLGHLQRGHVASVEFRSQSGREEFRSRRLRRIGVVREVGTGSRPAHQPRRLVVGSRRVLRRFERPKPNSSFPATTERNVSSVQKKETFMVIFFLFYIYIYILFFWSDLQ